MFFKSIFLLYSFLSIFSYIYSLFIYLKFNSNDFDSITINKDNLQSSPIFSISLSLNGQCNEDSQILPIGYFFGTSNGKYHKNIIKAGKCKKSDSDCQNIKKIIELNLYKWDGNSFCVNKKTGLNYEYYLNNSVEYNSECNIGFKKCGILDTNNRILCIEENNDCPINKILINSNELPPFDYNYKTLNLNNNKYLHYTNEAIDNEIIVNFTISAGIPCLDPNEINTEYPQYILDKTFKRYSCSHKNENGFNDDIYKYLDFILKSQLYEDNNIYNQIINLKNYPLFSLNEKMRLYVRNYFGINKNCIENKNNFALEELTELKEYFNKKFLILARTYIFIALELLLILNISIIHSVNAGDKYLIIFSNIVFCVVFGVIVVLNIIILFYIKEINSKLPCFDEKRKFEFLKIKQSIKKIKYLELSNLIIVCLELCVFEFSQIYFFYGRRKKENEPRVLSFDRKLNIAQNNCNISTEHKNETELNNLNSQN